MCLMRRHSRELTPGNSNIKMLSSFYCLCTLINQLAPRRKEFMSYCKWCWSIYAISSSYYITHYCLLLTITRYSSVLASHQYSLLTSTRYSPVLATHQYLLLTSTRYSPVLATHQYSLLTSTRNSPVLATHQYSLLTSTRYSPVLATHQHSLLTSTRYSPVLTTHQYSLLTSTRYSPVLALLAGQQQQWLSSYCVGDLRMAQKSGGYGDGGGEQYTVA